MFFRAKNLRKHFGGITAVDRVTFDLEEGEISSIIGPNGAGKTTLFNIITEKLRADEGSVFFDNRDITNVKPHELADLKMGRSFQITSIFKNISVLDNIKVAIMSAQKMSKNKYRNANMLLNDECYNILEEFGLLEQRNLIAGLLSHGDQKILDMGIAISGKPKIMLLDEPTAGMSPEETQKTTETIKKMARDQNISVLMIEHDMSVVFTISQKIRVMHIGQIIAEGSPEEIKNNENVQRIYLGKRKGDGFRNR
jgi:branched-chain amino acid transport system ATP-binding protein